MNDKMWFHICWNDEINVFVKMLKCHIIFVTLVHFFCILHWIHVIPDNAIIVLQVPESALLKLFFNIQKGTYIWLLQDGLQVYLLVNQTGLMSSLSSKWLLIWLMLGKVLVFLYWTLICYHAPIFPSTKSSFSWMKLKMWTFRNFMWDIDVYVHCLFPDHFEDIMGLLFKYIHLLQQAGASKWIFEEVSSIATSCIPVNTTNFSWLYYMSFASTNTNDVYSNRWFDE